VDRAVALGGRRRSGRMIGLTRRAWRWAAAATLLSLGWGAAFGQCPVQGTTPSVVPTHGNTAVTLHYGSTPGWPVLVVQWNGEEVEILSSTSQSCRVVAPP